MNFEDLQKTWQAQGAGAKVSVNADALLREVRRNEQNFRGTILRRDVIEVSACLGMTLAFGCWGAFWKWWSLGLLAFCCLFVGVFFITDRLRQRRKQPAQSDSLRGCVEASLQQVNHQIWLLKNVFWWYLLPPSIGLVAVTGQLLWSMHQMGRDTSAIATMGMVYFVTYGSVYGAVYWVNQFAVRKTLEPRRRELEELLAGLKWKP